MVSTFAGLANITNAIAIAINKLINATFANILYSLYQVHQRGLLLQHAVTIAFLHSVHEGLLILMTLADEHIVADGSPLKVKTALLLIFSFL